MLVWKILNNNFSIFHTNICSLQGNFDNLENLLNDLNHGFDVISLTETWNPENKHHLFSADKYHPFKGTTGTTGRSGAGLYIHKNLNPIPRPDLDFKYFEKENEEFESTWVEINNEHSPNIIIAAVYRHPTEKGEKFIEHLKKPWQNWKKKKTNLLLSLGTSIMISLNTEMIEKSLDSLTLCLSTTYTPV